MLLRKLLIGALVIGILIAGFAWKYYNDIFDNNIRAGVADYELLIDEGQSFDSLLHRLQSDEVLLKKGSFKRVAGLMNYKKEVIPGGRYVLNYPMSNRSLISKLRGGWQDPVNITIHNIRNIEELSGKLANNIVLDSLRILEGLHGIIASEDSISSVNILTYFIPNTYQVYWNVSFDQLWKRMLKEYRIYWSDSKRLDQLQKLNLQPAEVYTLASIVEKETNVQEEKNTIAGVYLNRLRKGIKLQADPTVVFATGNYRLKRILHKHLNTDSPFNTYKQKGLPPGPICMPSLKTLDAVLNAQEHEYIFFCAEPGYQGKHAFAKTLRGHNNNARVYRKWLNSEGIK